MQHFCFSQGPTAIFLIKSLQRTCPTATQPSSLLIARAHTRTHLPAAPRGVGSRRPEEWPPPASYPAPPPRAACHRAPQPGEAAGPGGRRGARGVRRGPRGRARPLFTWSPGRARRRERRPSRDVGPAGSWAGKKEAAGRAPPDAGEGAGASTPRRGVPDLRSSSSLSPQEPSAPGTPRSAATPP